METNVSMNLSLNLNERTSIFGQMMKTKKKKKSKSMENLFQYWNTFEQEVPMDLVLNQTKSMIKNEYIKIRKDQFT